MGVLDRIYFGLKEKTEGIKLFGAYPEAKRLPGSTKVEPSVQPGTPVQVPKKVEVRKVQRKSWDLGNNKAEVVAKTNKVSAKAAREAATGDANKNKSKGTPSPSMEK